MKIKYENDPKRSLLLFSFAAFKRIISKHCVFVLHRLFNLLPLRSDALYKWPDGTYAVIKFQSTRVMAVNGGRPAERRRCIKLWDMTSLGSVPVVRFFDVAAARLCAGDGPIAALVGGSSCSIQL